MFVSRARVEHIVSLEFSCASCSILVDIECWLVKTMRNLTRGRVDVQWYGYRASIAELRSKLPGKIHRIAS